MTHLKADAQRTWCGSVMGSTSTNADTVDCLACLRLAPERVAEERGGVSLGLRDANDRAARLLACLSACVA